MGTSRYIAEEKIVVFLQFDFPLSPDSVGQLQRTNGFALKPVTMDFNDKIHQSSSGSPVTPSSQNVLARDNLVYRMVFKPNSLKRGQCYQLQTTSSGAYKVEQSLSNSAEMVLCMSNCSCSLMGTLTCTEASGSEPLCVCHPNYHGEDCSQCLAGFAKNSKGECVRGSICVEEGGTEDCNGHGQCTTEGGFAKCICDEGFANDGFAYCARCADPLFAYPHEC